MKSHYIVGVERGYGPRHAFNAQEGAEAVPTALPSPPYEGENYGGKALEWVADQVRQGILPDEALNEIKRNPASMRSMLAYAEAAMAAGTLLSGGEGGKVPIGGEKVPMSVKSEIIPPLHENISKIAEANLPHEREYEQNWGPGDIETRVVYGVKRGQSIKTHNLGTLGLEGNDPNVKGIHVGDPDYWRQQLENDYGRTGGETILIKAADGDRLVEDPQYATDPETGIKSDSGIILTGRKELKHGVDWVFDGEDFKD